jgi:uncharacterized protein (TIGR02271 family)
MSHSQGLTVTDKRGVVGHIDSRVIDPDNIAVDIDGTTMLVPRAALIPDGENTFRVGFSFEGLPSVPRHPAHLVLGANEAAANVPSHAEAAPEPPSAVSSREPEVVLPVIEESVSVGKRAVETGAVRVHKRVVEREEVVEMPLEVEEISVERVPINRLAEGPVEVRQEGDVTIVPLVEEILVVEKRTLIREEIRMVKTRRTIQSRQNVVVRREEADVERTAGEPAENVHENPGDIRNTG